MKPTIETGMLYSVKVYSPGGTTCMHTMKAQTLSYARALNEHFRARGYDTMIAFQLPGIQPIAESAPTAVVAA
jgi:hypothetical protein